MCVCVTIMPGAPLLPLNPFMPGGPFFPDVPCKPGSPWEEMKSIVKLKHALCFYHTLWTCECGLTFPPSFPAVPGKPCSPGTPGAPGWPRSPGGPGSPDLPWKKYNNVTGSVIPMKTFSTWRIHTFVLTWGPTTPEGPGGPVFPWNPCSIENMEIKHVQMSFCVWGDKKNIFNQRPMTSLTGSPLWPGWPGSPSFPAGPYTQRHLVRNEAQEVKYEVVKYPSPSTF